VQTTVHLLTKWQWVSHIVWQWVSHIILRAVPMLLVGQFSQHNKLPHKQFDGMASKLMKRKEKETVLNWETVSTHCTRIKDTAVFALGASSPFFIRGAHISTDVPASERRAARRHCIRAQPCRLVCRSSLVGFGHRSLCIHARNPAVASAASGLSAVDPHRS
jgi:hypothetical protein